MKRYLLLVALCVSFINFRTEACGCSEKIDDDSQPFFVENNDNENNSNSGNESTDTNTGS